jgi:hypothetical protein
MFHRFQYKFVRKVAQKVAVVAFVFALSIKGPLSSFYTERKHEHESDREGKLGVCSGVLDLI